MGSLMIKPNSELSDQLSWNQPRDSRDRDGLDITLTSELGHLKGSGRSIRGNPIVSPNSDASFVAD